MAISKKKLFLPKDAVGIIYAGGSGTRLWPVSTKVAPKQINPTFSRHTLIVDAYKRARQVFPADKIIIVLTENLYKKVVKLIKLEKKNYLVQPKNADTAAAMGLAAMYTNTLFPEAVAVTIYSDHFISSQTVYVRAMKKGIRVAREKQRLLTVGTAPTYPSPDFGYIRLGKRIGGDLYQVKKFVEKPSQVKAQTMIKTGKYVWNTGVYVWKAESLLRIFKQTAPDIYQGLIDLRAEFFGEKYEKMLHAWYDRVRKQSFDKAISEKIKNLVVLVADYNWKDVGNWRTVYELANKDANGHTIIGKKRTRIISVDSKNCLIISGQKTVSLVGVKDLIVVQTRNELLVARQDQAHKVKKAAQIAGS